MDDNCAQDGVYAGRYVLVEYDTQLSNSDYDKGWYLVTDNTGKHIPYGSISSCVNNADIKHLYFNGPDNSSRIVSSMMSNIKYKVLYFGPKTHFTIINTTPIYIKVKRNGSYTGLTWEQFRNHYNYQGNETSLTNSAISELENQGIVHAHIANSVAHIENTSLFINENTEIYAVVLPRANYTYNVDGEFWTIEDTIFTQNGENFSYLSQIPNDASGNYSANFNIDKSRYKTARGYDSTVWQKVYQNGTEKYVMIAELNTIIPTFGVSADPPSLLPISPHFGADSTNAYYELHWQPSWGFRIKAANNALLMPKVQPNGRLDITDPNQLDSQVASIRARSANDDKIYYPSDQQVAWKQTFEDNTLSHDAKRRTLYYNPTIQKWENDTATKVPAAIYFNRSGFDSSRIAYSSDLSSEDSRTSSPSWNRYNANVATSGWVNEDNISLTPTGYSGNVYNLHDDSIDLKPQPDTQELSIMLPSIGDTVANVWDLVYGGRNTTETIRKTNLRNKEIAWEDAKGEPARRGLRLTGIDGNQYNTKQVDTLAGAINTAHDLIGMIISPNTADELEDTSNLDLNRIYYDTTHNRYLRKHKTYEYDAVASDMFNYNEQTTSNLNQEKINSGLYYELVNGKYVLATVYDPSKTYYLRQAQEQYTEVKGTVVDFPYQDYKWYQDYLGENSKVIQDILNDTNLDESQKQRAVLQKSDYILNASYQEGKDYYKITEQSVTLNNSYTPKTYWVIQGGDDGITLKLDDRETKTPNETYYLLDLNKLEDTGRLKSIRGYSGIYVPGKYSFKKKDGSYEIDLTTDQSCNGELAKGNVELVDPIADPRHDGQFKYYTLNVIRTYDVNGQEVLYRRIISYLPVTNPRVTADTFINGVYYIKTTGTNNEPTYELAPSYDPNVTTYYLQQINYIKIEDTSQVEIKVDKSYYRDDLVVYNVGMYFVKNVNNSGETIGFQEITRNRFVNDPDIIYKEVYVFGDKQNASNPPFLTINEAILKNDIIQRQDSFYQENTYHFKKNGSYILDTAANMTPGREYFLITPTKLSQDLTYYVPEEYYVKDEETEEFTLAIEPEKPNATIYKKEDLYVKNDTRKILPVGTKWNPNAAAVPDEITLATRREVWETTQMPNYSVSMGTLNGMILKMYQVLEPYDTLTRANDNVSGVLNQVKDILARFETMKSQEIMVVDNYGRAHSAAIATSQINSFDQIKETYQDMIDSVSKDKYPVAANVEAMQKKWITVNVDGDPEQPVLTVHHNFQPVTPTTSTFDFNGNGDTIDIITPIVDAMGHTVGTDTKTVTLPYGFKTFTISNENTYDTTDSIASGGSIVADNTQDTFTFKAANKWLKFITDVDNDTLSIAHKLHTPPVDWNKARETNKNADDVTSNSENDKLILHDIIWDEAAHMLEDHPHTYTLPYGFKFITVDNASDATTDLTYTGATIAAESTQDTVTLKPANKWVKMSGNVTDDSITFGHLVQDIDIVASTASDLNVIDNTVTLTDSNNKINVQDISHDEAGHLRSRKDHIYTLPYGFKFITTNGTVGDTATDITSNTNVAIALNTQDTFSIDVGNTWIKSAIDVANRKITLYHYVKNDIDTTASSATDFNSISTGIFSLNDISFDEAGHMIANKAHQYTLPYSFKTFKHTNSSDIVTDLSFTDYNPAANDIVAGNVIDSFTFAASNKWIRLKATPGTNQLAIAHLVNNFTPTNDTADLSTATTGTTTFTVVQSISKDEAGHLSAINTRQFTMPNNFGSISLINSENNTNSINSNTTGIEADCTHDGFTIAAGDRWTLLAGNADTDTITIGHATPDTTTIFEGGNQTAAHNPLQYGDGFKIPHIQADKFGHINSIADISFTLPSISLTGSAGTISDGTVIISAGLTSTSGAFTYNTAKVGSLLLDNWTYNGETQSAEAIAGTDSIIGAFQKLQKRIVNEETNRAAAINALDATITGTPATGSTLTAFSQTNGKVTATFESIAINASQVTVNDTTNFDARYNTKNEITTLVSGLAYTATGLGTGKTITSLTEANGIIAIEASDIAINANQVTVDNNTNFDSRYYTQNEIDNTLTALAVTSDGFTQSKTIASLSQTNGKISYTTQDIKISSNQISDLNTTISTAINALDGSITGTAGAEKTITALSQTDGKVTATFGDISITASQVTNFNTAVNNALPTGNDAFLTIGSAASTYQPKGNYAVQDDDDLYVKASALNNNVTTDTTFLFKAEDGTNPEERKTIDQLITYIKGLEERISQLENPEP